MRSSSTETGQALTRRRFAGVAGATLAAGLVPAWSNAGASSGRRLKTLGRRRPRSPRIPAGFRSRFITAGGLRQHAVIGGDGPPLLLVHSWPENWYAWRKVMPALARDFQVIAVDQRGIGLTDKPRDGYDTRTLARDLVALMRALGHERFAVVGHDTGMIISYALAADHPDRVDRLVVIDVPGPPGAGESPPLFVPEAINNRLWHIPVNRLDGVNEQLIRGREDIYFGYEFAIQAGKKLPEDVVDYYVGLVSVPGALRGSFAFYRAWDATVQQNAERSKRPLPMPVLAIGGAKSWGADVGGAMTPLATNVQSVVVPDCGHWVAEEAPQQLLTALKPFLASNRSPSAAAKSRPRAVIAAGQ